MVCSAQLDTVSTVQQQYMLQTLTFTTDEQHTVAETRARKMHRSHLLQVDMIKSYD